MAEQDANNFVQLKEISRRQGISLKYLEQIIIPLRKARLVESSRGAAGGYRLAKPPERISVGEIVALLEGGKSLSRCENDPESCERSESCSVRNIWKEATEALYDKLNAVSLADLVSRGKVL